MNLLACTGKNKKKYQKFALIDFFRKPLKKTHQNNQKEDQKIVEFVNELAIENVSYERLQSLAWKGIPHCLRPKIWKHLLRYAFVHATEATLTKKREEYQTLVNNYWKPDSFSDTQKKILRTIKGDVKRIGTDFNSVLKQECFELLLQRMLLIWHFRHPASGYVQGICDLVNPFLIVFISEYLPLNIGLMQFDAPVQTLTSETLQLIESDAYWCMSKMLEYVTKNYTNGFTGLQEAHIKVKQLLCQIDQELYNHFMKEKFDLFAFSFRNISTMMLRLFEPLIGIRMFDTFISCEQEYPLFMIYLLIAVLEKFAKKILDIQSDELMTYMQKLPTKQWTQEQVQIAIAEAYVYRKLYPIQI